MTPNQNHSAPPASTPPTDPDPLDPEAVFSRRKKIWDAIRFERKLVEENIDELKKARDELDAIISETESEIDELQDAENAVYNSMPDQTMRTALDEAEAQEDLAEAQAKT